MSDVDIRFVQVKTNAKPDKVWMQKAVEWKRPKSAVTMWVSYKDGISGNEPYKYEIV